jgi:hypothetical protein
MSTTTARLERHGLAADEVIRRLDDFYCYNVSVSLWADAVANRLEGPRTPAPRRRNSLPASATSAVQ